MNIAGSFTLSTLVSTYSVSITNFIATLAGQTIDLAGKTISSRVNFNGTGSWTLANDFNSTNEVHFVKGTFNSVNKLISAFLIGVDGNLSRTLNFGTSQINLQYSWEVIDTTNLSINLSAATINFMPSNFGSYSGFVRSNGVHYNKVNFNSFSSPTLEGNNYYTSLKTFGSAYINGKNSIDSLIAGGGLYTNFSSSYYSYSAALVSTIKYLSVGTKFAYSPDNNMIINRAVLFGDADIYHSCRIDTISLSPSRYYSISASSIITTNSITANGYCSKFVEIVSQPSSQINLQGGSAYFDYVRFTNVKIVATNAIIATNSFDGGGNTGLSIIPFVGQKLYWVGGTGNWRDQTHWASVSGGTSTGCIPNDYDSVFFDQNSFTANGQVVTIDTVSRCKNMDWTGTNKTVSVNGSGLLTIYGSLVLAPTVITFNQQKINMLADTNAVVNSYNCNFGSDFLFEGKGSWSVQSNFKTTGYILFEKGSLVFNGNNLEANALYSYRSDSARRNLDITGSTIVLQNGFGVYNNGKGFILNALNSQINIIFGGISCKRLTFNNVTLGMGGPFVSYTNNVEGSNTFKSLRFLNSAYLGGACSADTLTVAGTFTQQNEGAPYYSYLTPIITGIIKSATVEGNFNVSLSDTLQNYQKLFLNGTGVFYNSNNIDTLILSSGKSYSFYPSKRQNIHSLQVNGSCGGLNADFIDASGRKNEISISLILPKLFLIVSLEI
ncbi:MAG: hypothetical protein IPP51_05420 [Bacteroidetes bacterium]|nr:hypothetical protein [Bacteroidota bacterium]